MMTHALKWLFLSLTLLITPLSFAAETFNYSDVGQGEPLILIHPFPTDASVWAPQIAGLQKNFRIITLDLQGFGPTANVDGKAIPMSTYADQVHALMLALHIDKAIVGGESMGGYVALAFLKQYPQQVAGLILSDTQAIADTAKVRDKREQAALDILANGTAQFNAKFLPLALSQHAKDETKQFLKNILDAQSSQGMAAGLRGMALRADLSDVLASSDVPMLIITGDQDTLISPQQSADMHSLAKNSKLVTLQAAHLSSLEQPQAWNAAVIDMFFNIKI